MNDINLKKFFIPAQKEISLEAYHGRKRNLLVISPHPDDDVLGAGGTMAAAAHQGRGVFSVYITDGRGSPRKDKSISDDEMAALRQKEAISALQVIGAVGGFFLNMRSDKLAGEKGREAEEILAEIIKYILPEEIYLPAPYERHRTHQHCTRLSIESLRAVPGLKPILLGYSLWGSFWGGRQRVVRNIGPFIRKKVEAVLAHSSQIAYKNYQQGILGKNNCEAIFWESHEIQKNEFVEIYLDMTELLEYKEMTLENFICQDVKAFMAAFLKGSP